MGRLLAGELGWPYYEGDDYHPVPNVQKMARGEPLTDADRRPWLEALRNLIRDLDRPAVITCSALKASYRAYLRGASSQVHFVYLKGDQDSIATQLAARPGHYMPAELLDSQFEVLEEPQQAFVVSAAQPPEAIVQIIKSHFEL